MSHEKDLEFCKAIVKYISGINVDKNQNYEYAIEFIINDSGAVDIYNPRLYKRPNSHLLEGAELP